MLIKLAEVLRDSLDGRLPAAPPEAKDPRRLARIILTHGAPSPPAEAAEPADPQRGWHEENGERFVSVSPPEE